MACRYYDDIIVAKLQKWIPEASNLRVLKPDESKRLFSLSADDNKDRALKLPLIALSRNTDIELLSSIKTPKSYDGLQIFKDRSQTLQLNAIPIKLEYKLDIYTKTADEGDEYLRNFLFKLINNPVIKIEIPYNGTYIEHIANICVLPNIADTSDISERIFSGQFTRWTIQMEIQDAFLFSLPYRKNWRLFIDEDAPDSCIEISEKINKAGEKENLSFEFRKI